MEFQKKNLKPPHCAPPYNTLYRLHIDVFFCRRGERDYIAQKLIELKFDPTVLREQILLAS